MERCIEDIRHWMVSHRLLLNDEKTAFLLIGTRQQLSKVEPLPLRVGTMDIGPLNCVRNPGAWFDSMLSMETHINKVCSSGFYYLHNQRRIRNYLSQEKDKKWEMARFLRMGWELNLLTSDWVTILQTVQKRKEGSWDIFNVNGKGEFALLAWLWEWALYKGQCLLNSNTYSICLFTKPVEEDGKFSFTKWSLGIVDWI